MTYDAQRDYDDYLANTPESTRDPGVLKALTGAIKRDAAAKAADGPGFIPPVVDSTVEKSTAEFLAEQNQLEWKRRNQVDVDAVLAEPKFDSEVHAERRNAVFGRYQLGVVGGSTKIDGTLP